MMGVSVMSKLALLVWVLAQAWIYGAALILLTLMTLLAGGAQGLGSVFEFLVDNWILQALLGAWIAFTFQEMSARAARESRTMEASYLRKTEAAKALHSLIQKRIYATRRYSATIVSEPSAMQAERASYQVAVAEWNSEAQTHQVAIILEYGYSQGLVLDHEFFPAFAEVDRLLRGQRQRVQDDKPASPEIRATVDRILRMLSGLALDLNRKLLGEAIAARDILNGKVAVKHENSQYLSHLQILKAIMKPTVEG